LFLLVAHHYPRTFAHNIYNIWTQTVLSDPCLFNATLYATSSFMDVMQGRQNNPVTLRHKGETIRLIKDAVSKIHTNGLREEIIAVTTYLVYFAVCLFAYIFLMKVVLTYHEIENSWKFRRSRTA
jgi:hypothetical protein